ncbi:hypothetical protein ACLF6K_02510 [Streptomyces xanthophaeus]|uniref:hypothetical protein n=1 Tax=Streptomyces xanthophaeus TaxID=67385 RepID=UPI00398FEFD9
MSREQEPGYGWQAPPSGSWQAGPPAAAPAPAPGGGSSHRGAWIGAGATLAAAVITVFGAYLLVPGKTGADNKPPVAQVPPASPSSSPSAAAPAAADSPSGPGTPSAASPSASAPAAKAAGTVRWEGSLVITYTEDKDLDSTPPVRSEINADNDFSVFEFGDRRLRPERGAKAMLWADSKKVPSYADCAAVVDTQATGKDMPLKTGMTVCAKTDEGRVARLTAKETSGQASDTQGTFDVVVWDKS